MIQAEITYLVTMNDNGKISLFKDGGRVMIRDEAINDTLLAFIQVDLEAAVKAKSTGNAT